MVRISFGVVLFAFACSTSTAPSTGTGEGVTIGGGTGTSTGGTGGPVTIGGGGFAKPPKPPAAAMQIRLAAVTLSDDCNPGAPSAATPSAAAPAAPPHSGSSSMRPPVMGDVPEGEPVGVAPSRRMRRACVQSTLQVVFDNPGGPASTVTIRDVELVDVGSGTVVTKLTVREPRVWSSGDGSYAAWDQQVGADGSTSALYDLGDAGGFLKNGARAGLTYKVRVTFALSDGPRAVETTATVTSPATLLEPPVVT